MRRVSLDSAVMVDYPWSACACPCPKGELMKSRLFGCHPTRSTGEVGQEYGRQDAQLNFDASPYECCSSWPPLLRHGQWHHPHPTWVEFSIRCLKNRYETHIASAPTRGWDRQAMHLLHGSVNLLTTEKDPCFNAR